MSSYKIYLGNIHGEHAHDGFAGAVFHPGGVAPAISTMQGGGRQPMILLEDRSYLDGEHLPNQDKG